MHLLLCHRKSLPVLVFLLFFQGLESKARKTGKSSIEFLFFKKSRNYGFFHTLDNLKKWILWNYCNWDLMKIWRFEKKLQMLWWKIFFSCLVGQGPSKRWKKQRSFQQTGTRSGLVFGKCFIRSSKIKFFFSMKICTFRYISKEIPTEMEKS